MNNSYSIYKTSNFRDNRTEKEKQFNSKKLVNFTEEDLGIVYNLLINDYNISENRIEQHKDTNSLFGFEERKDIYIQFDNSNGIIAYRNKDDLYLAKENKKSKNRTKERFYFNIFN